MTLTTFVTAAVTASLLAMSPVNTTGQAVADTGPAIEPQAETQGRQPIGVPLAVEPVIAVVPAVVEAPAPVIVAPAFAAEPDDDVDEPYPDEPGDEIEFTDYDPAVDSPEAHRARHWIAAGAVLMSVGAILGIGGAAMAGVSDPCNMAAGNGCQADAQARASLAMAIPGLLMLMSGTAALALGITRRNRIRAEVAATRRSASLGVTIRF
jgi:hypothetical protein